MSNQQINLDSDFSDHTFPNRIPDSAMCFFKFGGRWCCVFGDFKNLVSSPVGFGATFDAAIADLKLNMKARLKSGIDGNVK